MEKQIMVQTFKFGDAPKVHLFFQWPHLPCCDLDRFHVFPHITQLITAGERALSDAKLPTIVFVHSNNSKTKQIVFYFADPAKKTIEFSAGAVFEPPSESLDSLRWEP